MEKKELHEIFWEKVDTHLRLQNKDLRFLAETTGLKYQTIIGWRAYKRLPNLESALLISRALKVSVELLCGLRTYSLDDIIPLYKEAIDKAPSNLVMSKEGKDIAEALDALSSVIPDTKSAIDDWYKIRADKLGIVDL